MELQLSPSEALFRDEIRTWLDDHLVGDFVGIADRGGPDDDDVWELRREWERELAGGGWLGIQWPKEYGGRAASLSEYVVLQYELGMAGAPARAGFHGEKLLAPTLLSHGTLEQKARFLPPMAASQEVWCQGYSEPGAGSDLANIATKAEIDGDEWVIEGQKIWTTFAQHSGWIFMLARTDSTASKHQGISYLLVPLDQPGIDIRPIRALAGGSGFNEVFFSGARTKADLCVGAPGAGWQVAMATLGHERATSVLGYQFAFQREMADLIRLVKQRGLQKDPVIRQHVGELWIGLEVLRANVMHSLGGVTRTGKLGPESSITKLYWSRWHQRFTDVAMDVLGPEAMLGDLPAGPGRALQEAWLRAPAETIYAGSSEIQQTILGERVLGLPR